MLSKGHTNIKMIIRSLSVLRRLSYVSGAALLLLVIAILCPIYLVPNDIEATSKDATPSSVTLAFTRTTATANVNVTKTSGSFATSTGNEAAAFNVSTNNATGYSVSLSLYDENFNTETNPDSDVTDLVASSDAVLESISGMVSANDFYNNAAYNNKWGIVPSKYNSAANTNYYPATTEGFTVDATESANTTANYYTVGVGVRADFSLPAGTYDGNYIVATVVANPVSYAIYYSDPSSEATGMPAAQTGAISSGTTATSVTLASAPSRTGYDFIGWCNGTANSSNITTTDGTDSCSDVVYDAGQTFGIDATGSSTDTYYLYAMWEPAYTMMQAATMDDCGDELMDSRDNNVYTTVKINGLCWMTKNLDLPGGTVLTSADSNVDSDFTLPASSTEGFDGSDYNAAFVYNSENTTCSASSPCYSYYSFGAASAGSDSSDSTSGVYDVSYDICPKGWRMPTKTEYYSLTYNLYSTPAQLAAAPFLGAYAGAYTSDSFTGGGETIAYWTATRSNPVGAYLLVSNTNDVSILPNMKNFGAPVRCVMKLPYMQDQDSTTLSTMMPNTGDYTTLYDKRDNTPYTVAKLDDGKYWMLDNLAIDLVATPIDLLRGNTNASNTSISYLKGGATRNPSTDPDGNFATAGVSDAWTSSSQDYYSIPMVNMASKDLTGDASDQWGNGSHKYGGYYNYCAATAGSYCYGNGTSAGTPVGNATEDICPAGWRMPTSGASGEYKNLCNAILGSECASSQSMTASATTSLQYKLSTPLSGHFLSGTAYSSDGYFWSSTMFSNNNNNMHHVNMHLLSVSSYRVGLQDPSVRYLGNSIRCLATDTYTLNVTLGTGVDSVTVGTTTLTSSGFVTLNQGVTYPISMTFDTNYEFDSWSATSGAIGSASTNSTTYTIGSANATLTAGAKMSYIPMQDATMANCGETMIDPRDGKTYTTAKIGNNCWMTTNLDLAGGTALSADDTDVDAGYISSFSTSSGLTKTGNTIVLPASDWIGFNIDDYSFVYNSGSTSCDDDCYSYYSWDAATLGSGRNIATDNTDAPYSICPKGWHLPSTYNGTNSTADFRALVIAYGGSASVQTYNASTTPTGATMYSAIGPGTTPNFQLAGFLLIENFFTDGTQGYYWSSTSYSNSNTYEARAFLVNTYNPSSIAVESAGNYPRRSGYSVRCVMTQYMQDQDSTTLATLMPNDGDSTILYDKRDGADYVVKKINGQYWMTQNLRITGTVSASLSNFTGNDFNVSEYSIESSDSLYATHCRIGEGYNYACAKNSGNEDTGVWYNYYSASAGTIGGANSNDAVATSDICPAGWHLPTGRSTNSGTDFNILIGNTYNEYQNPTAGLTLFDAVAGGYYLNGVLSYTSHASWWSATGSGTTRAVLMYDSSNGQFNGGNRAQGRDAGAFIRCVANNQ